MTQQLLDYINNCPEEVKAHFTTHTYMPRETILTQGNPTKAVYFLISGEAQVASITVQGMKHIQSLYEAGELFGEVEALIHKPILSSIEAITKCTVIQISSEHFKKWLLLDPNFNLYISSRLASKLYHSSIHSQTNIAFPLKHRILYFLQHYSKGNSAHGVSKQLIVESTLSNIRSVNRILKELVEENLVIVKNGVVWLNASDYYEDARF